MSSICWERKTGKGRREAAAKIAGRTRLAAVAVKGGRGGAIRMCLLTKADDGSMEEMRVIARIEEQGDAWPRGRRLRVRQQHG